jgi:hypothetical protein
MTRLRSSILGVVCSAMLAAPAMAQDDGGMMTLELNSILVATFEAEQPFLEAEAQRVHGLVEAALASSYLIVTMAEVPAFTDSDAEVYLRSCPDGQYIGCVFVVGGRAQTDWTIGGQMRAVDGGYQVFLSFIDVDEAKLVLDFDVVLDGDNDEEFQAGVLKIADSLMAGEVQQLDVKAEADAERQAQEESDERQLQAQQFTTDAAYEDPEADQRGDVGADAVDRSGSGRLSRDDLNDMEDRGGLTPWERAGLKKGQYKLYRNSGMKLRDFKDRLMGRKGEVGIRLSMQVGSGPFGQQHDTWYVQDAAATPPIRAGDIQDQALVHAQTTELSYGGQLELDVGLTPWMELGVFGGLRVAPYRWRFVREVVGRESAVPDYDSAGAVSVQGGLRLGVIPFPAYPVRPTLHVGASFWMGNNLNRVAGEDVPDYLSSSQTGVNNWVFAHVQPGAEVSIGRTVILWTRFDLDLPVLGRNLQQLPSNGTLSAVPEVSSASGFALGGSAGLMIRLRVGPNRR